MVETSYGEKHGKAVRSVFTDTDGSGLVCAYSAERHASVARGSAVTGASFYPDSLPDVNIRSLAAEDFGYKKTRQAGFFVEVGSSAISPVEERVSCPASSGRASFCGLFFRSCLSLPFTRKTAGSPNI